jgi:predicted N-formylglutamate amidohydrolase
MAGDTFIITCEHGGNEVPPEYMPLFVGHEALLATHRGWDMGALQLATQMAGAIGAPLFESTTTRLLIDLNRSIGHRQLHSEVTRGLPLATRQAIVQKYYRPHRDAVEAEVARCIAAGRRVVHIASHSFTPQLHGVVRLADVGFLYDPRRPAEGPFASRWLAALKRLRPDLRLRRNYPYEGKGDGLTALLRKRHDASEYVGMELEVNQRFFEADGAAWDALRADITQALAEVVGDAGSSVAADGPAPITSQLAGAAAPR